MEYGPEFSVVAMNDGKIVTSKPDETPCFMSVSGVN